MSETKSKYHAVKAEVDGYIFASRAEARRYAELKLLYNAGEIFDLQLQPKFECAVNKKHICNYIADFRYKEPEPLPGVNEEIKPERAFRIVVEDVKGVKPPVYKLKKRLVEALYGIQISEVK